MNDNELFELCKEVYKRTGWAETTFVFEHYTGSDGSEHLNVINARSQYMAPFEYSTPLYTSDYLLEKLPRGTQVRRAIRFVGYVARKGRNSSSPRKGADTPLKALLKLTIALHEAGELK